MSLIGTGEQAYVTSSPLQGQILHHGKPVSNARILRKVRSNQHQDWITEEFNTDDKGNFYLPVREETYDLGLTQFVSATQVDVELNGEWVNFWYSNNTRGELNSEFGGEQPQGLVCDLTQDEIIINGSGFGILAKCQWENMPQSDTE
ncbi:MAG: hypothetical protein CMI02_12865 [Oceanospirillaceae bacterium]|nr:hypothetical protein [Oceanospirillaceae bacterium]MBT12912.1 hypothetical protein [Oceanospirillaceae bacterium]